MVLNTGISLQGSDCIVEVVNNADGTFKSEALVMNILHN